MTDTATPTQEKKSQFREKYEETMSAIAEIDEKLDASQDTSGKRKFTNDLVEKYEDNWSLVTNKIVPQMENFDNPELLAASFYGIVRTLTNQFKEQVDKWLTEEVENQPKPEVEEVSDEEKKSLSETRSELARRAKLLIEMAGTFGEFSEDNPWPEPKRRGAVGKRGKRALSLYTWQIDSAQVDEDNDSPKGVSELLGFEKASQFTQALKDAKINTTSPPDEFTVTINGKEVYAHRLTEEEENEEDVTEPAESETEEGSE